MLFDNGQWNFYFEFNNLIVFVDLEMYLNDDEIGVTVSTNRWVGAGVHGFDPRYENVCRGPGVCACVLYVIRPIDTEE